jgi:16S rRNA (guanine527-N7)-methyltransferase
MVAVTEDGDRERVLEQGLGEMGVRASTAQRQRLFAFVDLLHKWNRTYNLTAIRDPQAMIQYHLLDSLAVLPVLQKSALAIRRDTDKPLRLADVGSGAGLPGLVLAILQEDWHIISIDKVDKKAAFQRQVCIELGLRSVEVSSARVETLPADRADVVISRAFSELAEFVRLAGHLMAPGGRMFAMKGQRPDDEIASLPVGWRLVAMESVQVPGLAAQRHLLEIERG